MLLGNDRLPVAEVVDVGLAEMLVVEGKETIGDVAAEVAEEENSKKDILFTSFIF
ncbi:9207_t:CDS:2 [Acaulospora colombiana]|uniref:9207_t:CDS:1 n=1 Tax=Acaulospora colombiana TaxID=27376 RepID=A0ACA9MY27_9GLOM|nr:9207_t:CDS:2 [Acaulospora colombiana]